MTRGSQSILAAYRQFLSTSKRLWWACVITVVLLLALLAIFSRNDAAPFIYILY